MLTIPSSIFKSYTKDLSLPIFELVLQRQTVGRAANFRPTGAVTMV